jgi:hypothetical protein
VSRFNKFLLAGVPALLLATACHASPPDAGAAGVAVTATDAVSATAAAAAGEAAKDRSAVAHPLHVLVHKSPTCGCCVKWVEHLRAAGFEVEVDDTTAMADVKNRLGVPKEASSCHTAEVGGYFVEGHVPADDLRRLLAEKPKARGISVPGMPMGSPGMEMPGGGSNAYDTVLVNEDGSTTVFETHPAAAGDGAHADHSAHDHGDHADKADEAKAAEHAEHGDHEH